MDRSNASPSTPDPDAIEFVRFCYRRRRVGWPELYDEMCAVAARGLFRGLGSDDLAGLGIGFSLFDMPALAGLAAGVVNEEQARRRPVAVMIARDPIPVMAGPEEVSFAADPDAGPVAVRDMPAASAPASADPSVSPPERTIDVPIRLSTVPAAI
jgi:hypothetical protein